VLARVLEQREQRQQQQDDDDPKGEIAKIGVHRMSSTGIPPVPDGSTVPANRGGFTSHIPAM
jgi:hypothetical protein